MSCYFRHIRDILDEAGLSVSPANKKQVDRAIHDIAGVSYKNCPLAWKSLKRDILSDEQERQDFIGKLKGSVS